ncbi:MAG: DUF4138 domain-containing protein [Bacteroidota bacterium]|nr:DUF4138 domain-containing protein [Bacteroidota bacterium]
MKKIKAVLLFMLITRALPAQIAQTPSRHLFISCNKTSTLEFPQMIESVDLGSRDVLAQKVGGMKNMLKVKAGRTGFPGTSMTVITADGKLYPFLVDYSDTPSYLDMKLGGSVNLFEKVASQKRSVFGISHRRLGMVLRLNGIFINHDIIYYQFQLLNRTEISYDIDMTRFYIRDKSLVRRTATQELEQKPLMVYGNTGRVGSQSEQIMVVGFRKFTLPDKKLLVVQIMEKDGGRNLQLKIRNRNIIRAKKID